MSADVKPSEVSITLRNGEVVRVNDHVYCSPNWSVRDGTPYSIARIMEFLPPEGRSADPLVAAAGAAVSVSQKSKGKDRDHGQQLQYTRVRLAWYYRPSDVSDRAVADSRLLLAAIYSEICDISQLRAKCFVIHRDKLSNLNEWKRKPDRFYFYRLFDPYIKKEFEVLLSTDVRNLPQHIRDILVLRYEYVVAEKEVVPDLTDSLRLCETCGEWCAHLDAVQCARCRGHFHMSCVNPPLAAKPSRGYGWTCAPCSRRHEDRVDASKGGQASTGGLTTREGTPKSGGSGGNTSNALLAQRARVRGRPRKERMGSAGAGNEEELQVKHYKLWPFRYFGLYTVAEDTTDPDDLIFPRAATRVGQKFQATVASALGEPLPSVNGINSAASVAGPSITPVNGIVTPQPNGQSPAPDIEERGGDASIEVLSAVNEFSSKEVDMLEKSMQRQAVRKDQIHSVDWLTEIVRRACELKASGRPIDLVAIKTPMHEEKWKNYETRYTDREWNDEEVAAFEDGIAQFGAELRAVRDEVGTRSMPEVVRFYGKWKNARLREENAHLREPDAYKKAKIPRSGANTPATQHGVVSDDDASSIVNVPANTGSARSGNYCAACRTRESRIWWKAPKYLATPILCDSCGLNWRKYADLNARPTTREETALNNAVAGTASVTVVGTKTRGAEKREGTPLGATVTKKFKISSTASTKSTPPPVIVIPSTVVQHRCLCCYRMGPQGKVLKCRQCGVTVHAGVAGVPPDAEIAGSSWICEICDNEKTLEYSLNTSCVLCPRDSEIKAGKNKEGATTQLNPPADQYLRICKPTECQGWVHALCSVFMSEVQYADSLRLRAVEAISTVSKHRWETKCSLCGKAGGAVVRCANCPKEYHVSCAWKYGHKFGFEIQPVKSSRRDITNMVTFKRETGAMNAVICCKEHASYRRMTYDICETNDIGETALQVYVRTYKQAPATQSHSLLRKAHRLDSLLREFMPNDAASATSTTVSGSFTMENSPAIEQVCAVCKTEFSPFFHAAPENYPPGTLRCHRCHFEDRPIKLEDITNEITDKDRAQIRELSVLIAQ